MVRQRIEAGRDLAELDPMRQDDIDLLRNNPPPSACLAGHNPSRRERVVFRHHAFARHARRDGGLQ